MSVYMTATITLKDPAKFQEYAGKVVATMAPFGGEPMLRARLVKPLAGEGVYHAMAVFTFPDIASVEGWYASEAYQALIPLREEGADAVISVMEGI